MKRCLPLAVSILANLGGGAFGVGIAYLLGWAVPSVLFPLLVDPYQVYRRFGPAEEKRP